MSGGADAFVGEFKHWRDVRGLSQSRLAPAMGYHRSYLSKIESGHEPPTKEFVQRAEEILGTGGALVRAFREIVAGPQPPTSRQADSEDHVGSIMVEHDHARLRYDDGTYHTTQRRRLFNGGDEPIARYLIRISVDRHPGAPDRSNQLYRQHPLTWEELQLTAIHSDGGRMAWRVQHDRDAFKEVWLLFENEHGRFPLYPGESTTIEYGYSVGADKWGRWFQRAVRLPTRHLSVDLDFPIELDPTVWGTETTMTAAALPLRTAVQRAQSDGRSMFSWSTDEPPLHARYRLEWNFRADKAQEEAARRAPRTPSQTMAAIGIVQDGAPQLRNVARLFDLPREAEDARRIVAQLKSTLDRVAAVHTFSKGMGLAAPQIGIDRAVAIVCSPQGRTITLLNPRVIDESTEADEQYEGCLSFFDVRGAVPRSLIVHVEHQDTDGRRHITAFDHGLARLVAHEVDHLNGRLYTYRMRDDTAPIPVSEYDGTGQSWRY